MVIPSSVFRRSLIFSAILFMGDLLCVSGAAVAAFALRFYWPPLVRVLPPVELPAAASYLPLFATVLVALMISFIHSDFYRRRRLSALDELLRVAGGTIKGWTVVLASTFLYRDMAFSRGAVALGAALCASSVYLFREIAKVAYDKGLIRFWKPLPILIIGGGRMSGSIRRVLGRYRDLVLIHKDFRTPEELAAHLAVQPAREVYAGEPDLDHKALIAMTEVCDGFDVPFKIVPDVLELRMGELVFDDSLGLPTYRVRPVSLHGMTFFYKRLFDILISLVVISLGFFPLLAVAVLVRLDSKGPIFYQHPRVGRRGIPFPFLKFRSMAKDADARLEDLKALNERTGPVFKMKNDPRITRVGKWIRKLSIDEFPQLLNVLRGEMSLVGPRPQLPAEVAEAGEAAKRRMNVLPGITGLWQVSGRAQLSYEQMLELDTYYIEHWSAGLDLKILLRTIPSILEGHGAY
jgi:exopolysaccharide biosynthesis polyprenyl glycosylphosphotransferase